MAAYKPVKGDPQKALHPLGNSSSMKNVIRAFEKVAETTKGQNVDWSPIKKPFENFGFTIVFDRNLVILITAVFVAGALDKETQKLGAKVLGQKVTSSKRKGEMVDLGQALLDGDGKAIYAILNTQNFKQMLKHMGIDDKYINKFLSRIKKITPWRLPGSTNTVKEVKTLLTAMTGKEYKLEEEAAAEADSTQKPQDENEDEDATAADSKKTTTTTEAAASGSTTTTSAAAAAADSAQQPQQQQQQHQSAEGETSGPQTPAPPPPSTPPPPPPPPPTPTPNPQTKTPPKTQPKTQTKTPPKTQPNPQTKTPPPKGPLNTQTTYADEFAQQKEKAQKLHEKTEATKTEAEKNLTQIYNATSTAVEKIHGVKKAALPPYLTEKIAKTMTNAIIKTLTAATLTMNAELAETLAKSAQIFFSSEEKDKAKSEDAVTKKLEELKSSVDGLATMLSEGKSVSLPSSMVTKAVMLTTGQDVISLISQQKEGPWIKEVEGAKKTAISKMKDISKRIKQVSTQLAGKKLEVAGDLERTVSEKLKKLESEIATTLQELKQVTSEAET